MPSGIGTAGAGAEPTSQQVARSLVNPLQARSVLAAGSRVFDSHGDPLSIPSRAVSRAGDQPTRPLVVPPQRLHNRELSVYR
jgi:hypothetical protein